MKLRRRGILALAAAGLAVGGWRIGADLFGVGRDLGEIFGAEAAESPAGRAFARDYQVQVLIGGRNPRPDHLAKAFLESTNFLDHHRDGGPLVYDGLFDPYIMPCGNRLSAAFAPPENDT